MTEHSPERCPMCHRTDHVHDQRCGGACTYGLTEAGLHVREVSARGSVTVRASTTGYVPCAREHEPDRVCLLPDGHEPVEAMSVPDHLQRVRRALTSLATGTLRGSSYGMAGNVLRLVERIEAELVAIEHKARIPGADPTVPVALAIGRLRDRYKADGVPEPRQVVADLTGALTMVVGPSALADHDERVMKRLLAYISDNIEVTTYGYAAASQFGEWVDHLSDNLPPEVFRG